MGLDLNPLLAEWPFDPHELNARLIVGDDGQRYLQMRLELGLLQLALAATDPEIQRAARGSAS